VKLLLHTLHFQLRHPHLLLNLAQFLLNLSYFGNAILLLKRLGDIVASLFDIPLTHVLDIKVVRL